MQAKKPTQSYAKCKASHIVNNVLKVLNHAARWKRKFTSGLTLESVFGSVTGPHWATDKSFNTESHGSFSALKSYDEAFFVCGGRDEAGGTSGNLVTQKVD